MELEAKLSIDFLDSATQIEINCAEFLLPPPNGIYLKTRLDPVMVDGRSYFVRRGTTTEQVADINTVNENVYDEDGIPHIGMAREAKQA